MESKKLPERKTIRLKNFDYSSTGAYFITICVKDRKQILSRFDEESGAICVPQKKPGEPNYEAVGGGAIDAPKMQLTKTGKIIERNLLSSEKIPGVKIDKYVIMPNHIHAIIILKADKSEIIKGGSSWAPTPTNRMLPHIVSVFKRFCNKEIGENVFQRGYYEHVVRDNDDYGDKVKYICENPIRWYYNKNRENL